MVRGLEGQSGIVRHFQFGRRMAELLRAMLTPHRKIGGVWGILRGMQVGCFIRRGPTSGWQRGVVTDRLPECGLVVAIRSRRDGSWDVVPPGSLYAIAPTNSWERRALEAVGILISP